MTLREYCEWYDEHVREERRRCMDEAGRKYEMRDRIDTTLREEVLALMRKVRAEMADACVSLIDPFEVLTQLAKLADIQLSQETLRAERAEQRARVDVDGLTADLNSETECLVMVARNLVREYGADAVRTFLRDLADGLELSEGTEWDGSV